jgi:hypothetical protein
MEDIAIKNPIEFYEYPRSSIKKLRVPLWQLPDFGRWIGDLNVGSIRPRRFYRVTQRQYAYRLERGLVYNMCDSLYTYLYSFTPIVGNTMERILPGGRY